jgi:hypothetical protein
VKSCKVHNYKPFPVLQYTSARVRARARTHTHTHTHIYIYNTYGTEVQFRSLQTKQVLMREIRENDKVSVLRHALRSLMNM